MASDGQGREALEAELEAFKWPHPPGMDDVAAMIVDSDWLMAHDAEVAAAERGDWETDVLHRFIAGIPDSEAADWAPDYIHLLTTIMISARSDESDPR